MFGALGDPSFSGLKVFVVLQLEKVYITKRSLYERQDSRYKCSFINFSIYSMKYGLQLLCFLYLKFPEFYLIVIDFNICVVVVVINWINIIACRGRSKNILRRNTWDVLVFNFKKINFDSWLARKQIQINIFILINLIFINTINDLLGMISLNVWTPSITSISVTIMGTFKSQSKKTFQKSSTTAFLVWGGGKEANSRTNFSMAWSILIYCKLTSVLKKNWWIRNKLTILFL